MNGITRIILCTFAGQTSDAQVVQEANGGVAWFIPFGDDQQQTLSVSGQSPREFWEKRPNHLKSLFLHGMESREEVKNFLMKGDLHKKELEEMQSDDSEVPKFQFPMPPQTVSSQREKDFVKLSAQAFSNRGITAGALIGLFAGVAFSMLRSCLDASSAREEPLLAAQ